MVLFLTTFPAKATLVTIDIEAMIDGRDLLIIRDNTLRWHHLDYAAVGRWGQYNEPTIISTEVDGVLQMDRVQWIPQWPEEPPADIHYEAFSSLFTGLVPSLPPADMATSVTWTPIQARGTTSMKTIPTGANGYTLIIEFYDGPGACAWYTGQISIEVIPEPATLLLFGLGAVMLRRNR